MQIEQLEQKREKRQYAVSPIMLFCLIKKYNSLFLGMDYFGYTCISMITSPFCLVAEKNVLPIPIVVSSLA